MPPCILLKKHNIIILCINEERAIMEDKAENRGILNGTVCLWIRGLQILFTP